MKNFYLLIRVLRCYAFCNFEQIEINKAFGQLNSKTCFDKWLESMLTLISHCFVSIYVSF
jgi:hypothetical protein